MALVVVPGKNTVACVEIGILTDPARAQDLARANLEQLPLDLVTHALCTSV
jgi:hypothetical protein